MCCVRQHLGRKRRCPWTVTENLGLSLQRQPTVILWQSVINHKFWSLCGMSRGEENAVMDLTLSPKSYGGISTPWLGTPGTEQLCWSHCSLPLLCAGSELLPEHQLQQNSVLNGSDPEHGLLRVFQAAFIHFQALSFLCVVDKHLFPLLVHMISALALARCHSFKGFFCCLFLSYIALFIPLEVFSFSFWALDLVSIF